MVTKKVRRNQIKTNTAMKGKTMMPLKVDAQQVDLAKVQRQVASKKK